MGVAFVLCGPRAYVLCSMFYGGVFRGRGGRGLEGATANLRLILN